MKVLTFLSAVAAATATANAQAAETGNGIPQGVRVEPRLESQQLIDGGRRSTIKYGPYAIPPNGMVSKPTLRAQTPCSNCFITAIQANIAYTDGRTANVNTGAWLHHMVITKGMSPIFASGNERTPLRINGKYKYGIEMGMGDSFMFITDLMSMSSQTQTVTMDITYEWIPKASATGYKNVYMKWNDVGQPAARTGVYSFKSRAATIPVTGRMLYTNGHVHDGGTHTILYVNNKEVCRSVMLYNRRPGFGADGATGSGDHDMSGMDHDMSGMDHDMSTMADTASSSGSSGLGGLGGGLGGLGGSSGGLGGLGGGLGGLSGGLGGLGGSSGLGGLSGGLGGLSGGLGGLSGGLGGLSGGLGGLGGSSRLGGLGGLSGGLGGLGGSSGGLGGLSGGLGGLGGSSGGLGGLSGGLGGLGGSSGGLGGLSGGLGGLGGSSGGLGGLGGSSGGLGGLSGSTGSSDSTSTPPPAEDGHSDHSHRARDLVTRQHAHGGDVAHISDSSTCVDFGDIRSGDKMYVEAFYDSNKYPLMEHNGEKEKLMGIMRVYIGA